MRNFRLLICGDHSLQGVDMVLHRIGLRSDDCGVFYGLKATKLFLGFAQRVSRFLGVECGRYVARSDFLLSLWKRRQFVGGDVAADS